MSPDARRHDAAIKHDHSLVREAVLVFERQCGGTRKAAELLDVDPGYLSHLKKGDRRPSARLARRLGLRLVVSYERLPDRRAMIEEVATTPRRSETRCFACSQENCGYKNCTCACHS